MVSMEGKLFFKHFCRSLRGFDKRYRGFVNFVYFSNEFSFEEFAHNWNFFQTNIPLHSFHRETLTQIFPIGEAQSRMIVDCLTCFVEQFNRMIG